MERIRREELLSPKDFSKIALEEREKIIALKKRRRIESRTFSYLFEDRQTVLNQMNEMILIENVQDEKELDHILNTYNDLIPGKNQFSVSMFIEISDEKLLLREMPRLSGIEENVYLVFGDHEVRATPEEGRSTETLESTLQYLKFNFTAEDVNNFKKSGNAFVVTRHINYKESAEIPEPLLKSLKDEIN